MERNFRHFTTILEAIRLEKPPAPSFALILNAPPEVSQALDDIRRRYDPAFKSGIPPHITIKRPAQLGDLHASEALRQVIGHATAGQKVFRTQLQGYGVFRQPDRNVLFLKVQDEKPFCELHTRVIRSLAQLYPNGQADQYEGDNFHPHLTIGNYLSEIDLAVLEHELMTGGYKLDFSFDIEELSLFILEPPQPWQMLASYPFLRPDPTTGV